MGTFFFVYLRVTSWTQELVREWTRMREENVAPGPTSVSFAFLRVQSRPFADQFFRQLGEVRSVNRSRRPARRLRLQELEPL